MSARGGEAKLKLPHLKRSCLTVILHGKVQQQQQQLQQQQQQLQQQRRVVSSFVVKKAIKESHRWTLPTLETRLRGMKTVSIGTNNKRNKGPI